MRRGFHHQKGEETIVRLIVAACKGGGGPDPQCRTLWTVSRSFGFACQMKAIDAFLTFSPFVLFFWFAGSKRA